ncbi:carbohydrate sulfotransferase 15 [Plakobranchus ocellatus]|uniref:Carbohydrate sulfotransferase 15 n=1 Tax=Plakobranchus ocellatus TaxID=259542 RepID=A0AAV4AWB1_9GAST|nr:carbohydrate sulfotransferase 15 [Plakobranchus ocellatus]
MDSGPQDSRMEEGGGIKEDRQSSLQEDAGVSGNSAGMPQSADEGKFDLRQFVNSTSRWPMQEDDKVLAGPSQSASGAGDDSGLGQRKEKEVLELCDLPGQMVRSVYNGGALLAILGVIQAIMLWMLEKTAVFTPRAVDFACRFTAVHLPVLCGALRDWTTNSAPRIVSQTWHVLYVSIPQHVGQAYHTVMTIWIPAAVLWSRWLWCRLLVALSWGLVRLRQLAVVRSVLSHSLGLLCLNLHRCYNYLVVKFRSRFPDAFERMVGLAGAFERTCVPAVNNARSRLSASVRSAWKAVLTAIMVAAAAVSGLMYKVKVATLGGSQVDSAGTGSEQSQSASGGSRGTTDGSRLESVVSLVATCGRDFRDGSFRLRCVSPLKHRLRRLTPRSSFIAILVLFVAGFVVTTVVVFNGGRVGLTIRAREKPRPVDWFEYLRASRRPRLEGEEPDPNANDNDEESEEYMDWKERELAEGIRWRKKKLKHKKKNNKTQWEIGDVGWKQVSDVIGLMAKKTDTNATAKPVVHKKILMSQIELLRDAMMDEKSRLPVLEKPPTCVGDIRNGEVEDILCIPRPKFLSHVKNPCWYVGPKTSEDAIPELKCLPYFHILGCAKSGTTDLWNRLMSHPHVISNDGLLHKEALWWSWQRYGIMGYKQRHIMTFEDYVDLFQDAARQIRASMESETLHQQILITGEASPPDFWDFRGWTNITQNRNSNTPIIATPHLMRHIYPDPKFILMFREPIDRLYSDYFFVGGGLTSDDFHNDVLATIDILAKCVKSHGLQRCFYDRTIYAKLPVRLPFSCYSLYMQEWLQVFPRENFLLLKLEEYKNDLEGTLKSVMEFLGLGPLKEAQLELIAEEERSRVTAQRKLAGPMQNATREILHQLLDPCTKAFAKMVGMDKFDWSNSTAFGANLS